MLCSSKSKAKLLLTLAEAGQDSVGRFFTVEDSSLFPSPQHSAFTDVNENSHPFSAWEQLPLPDLVLPQVPLSSSRTKGVQEGAQLSPCHRRC